MGSRTGSRAGVGDLGEGPPVAPPFQPFAQGGFPTPSGKAELYKRDRPGAGLDPVAEFVPPRESRHGDGTGEFPLELLAREADNFLNSTFSNLDSVERMERTGRLEISPEDAPFRGISEGDRVRVLNRRGEIVLKARLDPYHAARGSGGAARLDQAGPGWCKY
jgi:anaerobic selenocysteine-containing dehydrogenase